MSGNGDGARAAAPTRRATSADVAREAGVSRATVSYVLNNVRARRISPATRALVLNTAQRLGHVPDASARALRRGQTNVVLALVHDFTVGHIRDQVLEGLDRELIGRGYVLLVHRYNQDLRELAELWPIVDPAVVVSMSGLSVPEETPALGLHPRLVHTHNAVNHRRAGEMQVEYLALHGHTRLGYAYPATPGIREVAQDRLKGSMAACRRLGLPEMAVVEIDHRDVETAKAALDRWRQATPKISAVCAHNDELAIMLQLVMASRNLRIGTDLAIIGMDDIPLARTGITTIAIDVEQYTARIVERVVAFLEGRPPRTGRKPVLRLVARESA